MPSTKRISILSDNRSAEPGRFRCEHGLSALVRTPSCQILLDTGASDAFADNAERMGIDLSEVDYVFISHGHADHAGGLRTFLERNRKAKVIVSPDAVSGRFCSARGGMHAISCEWPLDLMQGRTLYAGESITLAGSIHVIARIPGTHAQPSGNRLLFAGRDGEYVPDDFRHELVLYWDGLCYTGCAHSGLENILEACPRPVGSVLGGFHLPDARDDLLFEPESELAGLAERLARQYPQVTFLTGHCTGDAAFRAMRPVLGPRLRQFACGMEITL